VGGGVTLVVDVDRAIARLVLQQHRAQGPLQRVRRVAQVVHVERAGAEDGQRPHVGANVGRGATNAAVDSDGGVGGIAIAPAVEDGKATQGIGAVVYRDGVGAGVALGGKHRAHEGDRDGRGVPRFQGLQPGPRGRPQHLAGARGPAPGVTSLATGAE
jgi:hypothetical protein